MIYRHRNTRLGIKMGAQPSSGAALGWTLIQAERPKPAGRVEYGDTLALVRKALDEDPDTPLFVYLSDEAYAGTRGHTDGLTREEHAAMVEKIAQTLDAEGRDITIMEID